MESIEQISAMIARGEKKNGLTALTNLIRAEPRNADAWLLMANIQNDPARKADCFRQILKFDPHNSAARLRLEALTKTVIAPQATASLPVQTAFQDNQEDSVFGTRSPKPAASQGMPEMATFPPNTAILKAQDMVNKEKHFMLQEGLSKKALYLFIGVIFLILLFAIMQLPPLLLTGKMAESGRTPTNLAEGVSYFWAMGFSLVIFFLMLFTMNYGSRGTWLGKMKDGIIKYAIYFAFLFLPVSWYFMGRGIYIFFFVDMDQKVETK